ncbi:hypothetical protein BpHYR1_014629 [Brachionus plicatilis]|uniref:Uncharacterized protein n=1 Tax=Brachionus plicatilis TaxID=10195 RepID=A0A3M7T7N0_BRAPC|nr:hypothetical protein BpHYR1_014629 [Brachionus plicatilis]
MSTQDRATSNNMEISNHERIFEMAKKFRKESVKAKDRPVWKSKAFLKKNMKNFVESFFESDLFKSESSTSEFTGNLFDLAVELQNT